MAGRLRSVILAGAVMTGLPAAVPYLAITSGSGIRVEHRAPPRHGLGTCAPGVAQCDPGGQASLAAPAWVGATFVAAAVALAMAVRWAHRRTTTRPLARRIPSGIDHPRIGTRRIDRPRIGTRRIDRPRIDRPRIGTRRSAPILRSPAERASLRPMGSSRDTTRHTGKRQLRRWWSSEVHETRVRQTDDHHGKPFRMPRTQADRLDGEVGTPVPTITTPDGRRPGGRRQGGRCCDHCRDHQDGVQPVDRSPEGPDRSARGARADRSRECVRRVGPGARFSIVIGCRRDGRRSRVQLVGAGGLPRAHTFERLHERHAPFSAGISVVAPVVEQTPVGAFDCASRRYFWLRVHAQDGIIHIESPAGHS
jgi:hypothetical protein